MSDTDRAPDTASAELPLPEANFEFLVFSLVLQAQQHLGLLPVPGGEGDDCQPDLRLARHGIDLLAVLFEKTKGNLSLEEHRYLENSLTELRFRYVQSVEAHKKQQQPQEQSRT